ncbi:DUF4868 domain-containing protein [Acinetobacter baumannii]|uniref:anti-phage protein KwaB n=1 Tax=Acinetobacter baumannii TaxID=470 RepID=UPI00119CB656|nr:anti-phage protein KwaB [Acinetobacter baumannii]MCF1333366.1 DUF4868 domain-containing protein [Acinetobacter baumannii]MCP9135516.1 DUF4868 domain-containing protein [Acinetobacter baumannii]MCZ3008781.1 DUF4868 domain-containing protein [Acinetobacter baumannii]MDW3027662.1 anti-phage protein KwaB [Acinetobacter baumannii]TWO44347.1 DUF4868 domain-containing protein [Acinetobacter baumannii]
MLINDLQKDLNKFVENQNDFVACVYGVLQDENTFNIKKLDIAASDQPSIRDLYLKSTQDQLISKTDLSLIKLSSCDDRREAIYEYDLELPANLSFLKDLKLDDNLPKFNFGLDDLSKIKGLIVEIGNETETFMIYKSFPLIHLFGRGSLYFGLKKEKERFERIDQTFLRLTAGFQLLIYKDILYVVDLSFLEKSASFKGLIKAEAEKGITAIENLGILDSVEPLKDMLDDLAFSRKLTKVINDSPVIKAGISNVQIINFIKQHTVLSKRIKISADGTKIELNTKVSKNEFLRVLLDDHLYSVLTSKLYIARAKDDVA